MSDRGMMRGKDYREIHTKWEWLWRHDTSREWPLQTAIELHLSQEKDTSSRDYWKKGEVAILRTWWTMIFDFLVFLCASLEHQSSSFSGDSSYVALLMELPIFSRRDTWHRLSQSKTHITLATLFGLVMDIWLGLGQSESSLKLL